MAFSQEVIDDAWKRSGGVCECNRLTHGLHQFKHCDNILVKENQGRASEGTGRWEAHHTTAVASGGKDILSNCEILCVYCHGQIPTP
jgi:hypothetical protein